MEEADAGGAADADLPVAARGHRHPFHGLHAHHADGFFSFSFDVDDDMATPTVGFRHVN